MVNQKNLSDEHDHYKCKVFCMFQQIFSYGKVKSNTTKRVKTLSIFCCQDIPKMSCIVKSNPLYKEWFIWTKFNQNHEPFTSLFYMLFRMHDMDKDFSCIAVYDCIFLSFLLNIKPYNIWYWCSKHKNLFQNIWKKHIYLIRSVSITTEKTEFCENKGT